MSEGWCFALLLVGENAVIQTILGLLDKRDYFEKQRMFYIFQPFCNVSFVAYNRKAESRRVFQRFDGTSQAGFCFVSFWDLSSKEQLDESAWQV